MIDCIRSIIIRPLHNCHLYAHWSHNNNRFLFSCAIDCTVPFYCNRIIVVAVAVYSAFIPWMQAEASTQQIRQTPIQWNWNWKQIQNMNARHLIDQCAHKKTLILQLQRPSLRCEDQEILLKRRRKRDAMECIAVASLQVGSREWWVNNNMWISIFTVVMNLLDLLWILDCFVLYLCICRGRLCYIL